MFKVYISKEDLKTEGFTRSQVKAQIWGVIYDSVLCGVRGQLTRSTDYIYIYIYIYIDRLKYWSSEEVS